MGQALAEGIESGCLRLQFSELQRECIEVAVGIGIQCPQPIPLGGNECLQLRHFAQICTPRIVQQQGRADTHRNEEQRASADHRRCEHSAAPSCQIDCCWQETRVADDNDIHASADRFVFVMPPRRNLLSDPAKGLKPVAECIALDALADRARALDALDERLRHLLPAAVARETRLADVRNGRIVFLASSATWASRIRLHQSSLLAEARIAVGDTVERFAVKVAPLPTVPPDPTKPKPLSSATARHLRATAKSLSDPEMQDLYLKLASIASDE
ncbi:MAG: DUF721 domain-containing protein [Dokdonella sp.]